MGGVNLKLLKEDGCIYLIEKIKSSFMKKTPAGSAVKPVYVNSSGVPTACSYTLGAACEKNVTTEVKNGNHNLVTSNAVAVALNDSTSATSAYSEGIWTPQIGYTGESTYYYLHDGKYKKIGNVVFLTCLADHFKANGNDAVYIAKSSFPFAMAADGFISGQINNTYLGGSGLVSYSDYINSFSCPSKSFSSDGPSTYTISIVYTI